MSTEKMDRAQVENEYRDSEVRSVSSNPQPYHYHLQKSLVSYSTVIRLKIVWVLFSGCVVLFLEPSFFERIVKFLCFERLVIFRLVSFRFAVGMMLSRVYLVF